MQYNLKLLSLFVQFDSHLLELSFSREIQTNSKTLIKNVFPESAKEIVHTIQWFFQLGKEICQRVCSRNLFYVIKMSHSHRKRKGPKQIVGANDCYCLLSMMAFIAPWGLC